ncbi:MAG: CPBP family intramembrane metalloprotease [Spirochaetes bacterium]|jgi:membrane protease YdiL (CAAX protease family)|nr:CPBP family intramembrane metalloprotease [Spirochaetota bacterium]
MSSLSASRLFIIGILVEGGLGLLGLGLAALAGLDIIGMLLPDPGPVGGVAALGGPVRAAVHVALGVAATLPPLAGFFRALRSEWPPLRRIRRILEHGLLPHFAALGIPRLALLAALAGAGEELLFRGFFQPALAPALGEPAALLIAAALFGLVHWITPFYALYAGILGVYLGALFLLTGSLIAPILCHGVYDLVALGVLHHRVRRAHAVDENAAHRRAGEAGHLSAGMEGGASDVREDDDVVE